MGAFCTIAKIQVKCGKKAEEKTKMVLIFCSAHTHIKLKHFWQFLFFSLLILVHSRPLVESSFEKDVMATNATEIQLLISILFKYIICLRKTFHQIMFSGLISTKMSKQRVCKKTCQKKSVKNSALKKKNKLCLKCITSHFKPF